MRVEYLLVRRGVLSLPRMISLLPISEEQLRVGPSTRVDREAPRSPLLLFSPYAAAAALAGDRRDRFRAWAAFLVATSPTVTTSGKRVPVPPLRPHRPLNDSADIYLERRGGDWEIVVVDGQQRAYRFDVAELPLDQRERVMAYMVDRMPVTAVRRMPELLKREAPSGIRALGDQQI